MMIRHEVCYKMSSQDSMRHNILLWLPFFFFFIVIANIMFIEVDNVLVAITSFDHFYLRWGMLCDHKYYKDCANANRESIKKLTWWMFKEIIKKRHEDFIWRYVDK
jgi:hypothetical protein